MAIDMIARALALSGGGGGGGGTTDYNDLSNRPQINGTVLRGNKTSADLGLVDIDVVSVLPSTMADDTIYVIPGDSTADPPIPDTFYVYEGGNLYKIQSGRVTDVDYATEIVNRPKIDNVLLKEDNNTHERLELISEKDFVTTPSDRTDGMEFLLPEGTPDNPIELSEIDDSASEKYALNKTSSNNYINTQFDDIRRALEGKTQILVVPELPTPPARNSIYFVETLMYGVYEEYLVDSLGQVYYAGTTEMGLDDYVPITRKVGSNTLEHDITTQQLLDDIKAAKRIDLSYLKDGVALSEMPDTPDNDTILTTAGIKKFNEDKQDKLVPLGTYYDPKDTDILSGVFMKNGKLSYQSITFKGILDWLIPWFVHEVNSNSTDQEVPTSKAVYTLSQGIRLTGDDAFKYYTNGSYGVTISGDYQTSMPRQFSVVGRRCTLSFHAKGSSNAHSSSWVEIGQVPSSYRPAATTSIVAMVYGNTNGNAAAGGYINTNGWLVLWMNDRSADSNFQVRVNASWDYIAS